MDRMPPTRAIGLDRRAELCEMLGFSSRPVTRSTELAESVAGAKIQSSPHRTHDGAPPPPPPVWLFGPSSSLSTAGSENPEDADGQNKFLFACAQVDAEISAKLEALRESSALYLESRDAEEARRIETDIRAFMEEYVLQLESMKKSAQAFSAQSRSDAERAAVLMLAMGGVQVVASRLNALSSLYKKLRSLKLRNAAETLEQQNSQREQHQEEIGQGSLVSAASVLESEKQERKQSEHSARVAGRRSARQQEYDEHEQAVLDEETWTPEMVHALDEQNDELLEALRSELDVARQVETTANEVAAMNELLATKVQEQSEQVDGIVKMAYAANAHLDRANYEIDRMATSRVAFRNIIVGLLLFAIFSVLLLHWVL
ncbi:Syntaxin-18 [Porphyridium purpureum]|uniref:Syntaxin-18 n=1 Tax=Porphyridium purpureum TaxID=35688 RepID=A0A5J4YT84_PORPP|nr:Syntaxin-18 [Porphyridium purpureum]|eukprot:POR2222..scf227_4